MPLPPVSVALASMEAELAEPMKPASAVDPECAAEAEAKEHALCGDAGETMLEAGGEASGKDSPHAAVSEAPASHPEEAEAEDAEEAEEASGKRQRKQGLRARVLAELKSTSSCDMKARLESQLAEQDALISGFRDVEAAKQKLVEEALAEVERLSQVVKEAAEHEEQVLAQAKELRKRKKEAAKESFECQKEVSHHEDLLVILGFEVERRRKLKEAEASMESEKDAKRQKIQELLQVVEDAKKAQDEMRQREKEARQAVRQLQKEQKQLQLGPFGRRVAARKAKASKSTEDSEDPKEAACETSVPVVDLRVPVKREGALMPFPTHPRTEENLVISIEDSQ